MKMRNLNFLSWLKSLWYTLPVVLTIPMLLVCAMESAQRVSPSLSEIRLQSMRTLMPTSEDETQEKSTRLEIMRLTIVGWFLIHASGFGFFAVTSTWSVFSLSRQSSTSTSMSTRVMIAQQWSLGPAWMRSSYIWICTMCLHAKEFGDCLGLTCMRSFQTLSVFRSISHDSKQSPGMQR